MVSIELHNASVEFAIYNARGRSLRSDLLRRVGGKLGSEHDHVVVHALKSVNLTLGAGDRLAIVGHNGAGKSTLLRVLSRAYEPSSGTAKIQGKVSSMLDLAMGMDFELTGRQNIVLRSIFLGLTFAQADALVPDIADFTELGSYLDLPMRTYSTGMVLRLAFGVSTAVQPDIILLDELIGVGDAAFADKAKLRLDALVARAGILVLASHSNETLRQYCTRAVWLRQGELVAEGPLEDILAEQVAYAAAELAKQEQANVPASAGEISGISEP